METENLGDSRGFVTMREYGESQDKIKKELLASQEAVKRELTKRLEKAEIQHDKLDDKINGIDDKVDQVRNVVLPLEVAMNSTALNTEKLVKAFDKFADSQEHRNTQFVEKFHTNDLKVASIENKTNNLTDRKTYNIGVTAAMITFAGLFVTGIFQLAPVIMTMILER